jgi:hypothetical protein
MKCLSSSILSLTLDEAEQSILRDTDDFCGILFSLTMRRTASSSIRELALKVSVRKWMNFPSISALARVKSCWRA